MDAIKKDLNRLATVHDIHPAVIEFVENIITNWHADGGRGGDSAQEVRSTTEQILREAGLTQEQWEECWKGIYSSRSTDEQTSEWDIAESIVPIENPVQMNLSPISAAMTGNQKVSLDWLSTKKTVASQVDREKLNKVVSRNRQRAEKRGLRPSNSQLQVEEEIAALSKVVEWDPQAVVDELLAEAGGVDGARPSRDLLLENFDITLGGKRIITNGNLLLAHGRRYGLVGRNGVGKSTLLRNISSRQLPVPAAKSILHVEQEVVGDDTVALQSVLAADFKREALLAEERRLQTALQSLPPSDESMSRIMSHRLEAVYRILHEMDAASAEARASTILNGLGFTAEDQKKATRHFSGGWRMRIALARALFCQPDLLLLDEPTNMLDFPSVVWLEGYLTNWPGTLLVVSHDRCFLDNVATDMVHMHNEQLESYRGNYAQFLSTKEERLKNQQREYDAQLQYRQHLQAFVDRWRYNANRAPQAQSRLKILEKLPELKPVIAEAPVVLRFPPVESINPPILQLSDVSFSYPPREEGAPSTLILEHVDFNAQPGARMAIVGPNGAGKTTLLKLLNGLLSPTSGQLYRHGRLRIGLFTQHHVDQLDLSLSPLQLLQQRFPGNTEEEYRHQLGAFGVSGPLALQTIRTLSGGQKSRVVFAMLGMERPHVMILDEPTNHLDMDTIDAMITALRTFTGGVLVVSHDKRFIELLDCEIWICAEHRLRKFDGTIHDYANSLLRARK
jgi:ATP-binding cassette subfamily F protein 3